MTNAEWLECAISVAPIPHWYGKVYSRPQVIEPFGTYRGGTHPYDHTTIFGEGIFLLRTRKPSNDVIERSFRVPRFGFGVVNIKAEYEHDILNLTADELHFMCVSYQPDITGEIREGTFHEEC